MTPGRGLALMRDFFDVVSYYNDIGNELTLTKSDLNRE
jgi:hypothetical protein